jgi:hypothetical protein
MVVSDIIIATDLSRWNNLGPSGDPPLLTTRFDPSPACATQWMQNPVNTTNIRSGDYNFFWQSTNGNTGGRTGVQTLLSSNYYELCRPFTQPLDQSFYTGICTKSQTIVGIQEQRFGSSRRWKGWCCDRLFATIKHAFPNSGLRIHQGNVNGQFWSGLSRRLLDS